MQNRALFSLVIIAMLAILAAGCTGTIPTNATPVTTSPLPETPVPSMNATPAQTSAVPTSLPATPVTTLSTPVTESPEPSATITTSGTVSSGGLSISLDNSGVSVAEPSAESLLENQLAVSSSGANFVADSTHYVPAYSPTQGVNCNKYQNGTYYLFGTITSRSDYPLNVSLEVDIAGTGLSVDNMSVDDSLPVPAHSSAAYKLSIPATSYCGIIGNGNNVVSFTGVAIGLNTT